MHFFEVSLFCSCPQPWKAQIKHCLEPGTSRRWFQQVNWHEFTGLRGAYTKPVTVSGHPKCYGLPGVVLSALPSPLTDCSSCSRSHQALWWSIGGRQARRASTAHGALSNGRWCMKWWYSQNMWHHHTSTYPILTGLNVASTGGWVTVAVINTWGKTCDRTVVLTHRKWEGDLLPFKL